MKLQKKGAEFEKLGVQIVAVSTEDPEALARSRTKAGAEFPFVGDPDGALLDTLGLRHVGGHPLKKTDIARPASVLVRRDGTLAWSSYAENYRVRPTPGKVLAATRKALSNQ